MLSKAERLLGRIALERGVIGPDALARAIEAKERAGGAAPELTDILVEQNALTIEQQRTLQDAVRDAARRRAAVKWAVKQAGRTFEGPAEGDLPFVVEGEGAWAGPGVVEIPPAGSIQPPPARLAGPAGGAPGARPGPGNTLRLGTDAVVASAAAARGAQAGRGSGASSIAATPVYGQPSVVAADPAAEHGRPAGTPGVEEDLAIAKVAMERGLVTLAEVREALQAQADFAAIGRPLPLGQVLIKRRAIDVDTFVDLTRESRARSVRCSSCGVLSLLPRAIAAAQASVEGRCPRCSAALPILRSGATPTPPPVAVPPRRTDRGVPYRPRPVQEPMPGISSRGGIPPTRSSPMRAIAAPEEGGAGPAPADATGAGAAGADVAPNRAVPPRAPPPHRDSPSALRPSVVSPAPHARSTEGNLAAPDEIPLPDLDVADLDGGPPGAEARSAPPIPTPPPATPAGGSPELRPSSDPYGIDPGAFDDRPSDDVNFSGVGAAAANPAGAAAGEGARPSRAAPPPVAPVADLISAASPPPAAPAAAKGGPRKPRGESLAGQMFGRYEILAEIARGGMGVVYRARERDGPGRVVALKVLKDGITASDKQVRRFKRETEAVAKLKHRSIVPIYDVGCEGGRHYFTMDYIDGLPADELIRRGPVDVPKALAIAEEVARAIHHAHERGVIHRDIKPANVLLDHAGGPHITDFGLAKNVDRVSAMTKTGAAVGTPFYMPPEQAKGDGKEIDHRVDVYAIGVVLYEMLTSELPFDGETTLEVYHKILQDEVPIPSRLNAAVDHDVDTIVGKCMAKHKGDRYETALALAEDIRRKLDGKPIEARPPGAMSVAAQRVRRIGPSAALIGGALVLSFLVAGGVLLVKRQRDRDMYDAAVKSELADLMRRVNEHLSAASSCKTAALARFAEGRTGEALDEIARGEKLLERPREWIDLEKGVRFKENLAEARGLLERAESKDLIPIAFELASLRGRALASRAAPGDRAALSVALEAFDRAIALDGRRPGTHLERGRALLALGKLEDAESAFGRAAEGRKESAELTPEARKDAAAIASEALLLRGGIRARLGAHRTAEEDWKEVEALERAAAGGNPGTRLNQRDQEDQRPTRYADAALRRALSLAEQSRTDEALRIVKQLFDEDGGFFAAKLVESEIERGRADLAAAERTAQEAIGIGKKRPEGYVALGRALLEEGRLTDAEKAFDAAIKTDAQHAPALLMHSLVLDWLVEQDRARQELHLARTVPAGEQDPVRARAALRAAEAARAAGEPVRISARPPSVPAGFDGGAPGLFLATSDAALAGYDEAIALDRRLFAAHLARARLRIRTGDTDGARRDLARAAELEPDRAALENAEGLLSLALGDAKKAGERFAAARGLAPEGLYPEAAANEGHALVKAGETERARKAFAIALQQEDAVAAEADEGLSPAAQLMVRLAAGRGMGARPDAEAAVFFRIGRRAGRRADAQSVAVLARPALERATGLAPGMVRPWVELARILRSEGKGNDFDAALAALDRAVRANPYFEDARVDRGFARLRSVANDRGADPAQVKAEAAKALSDFDAALALSAERLDARLGRARALLVTGDIARAEEEAERVVDGAVRRADEGAMAFLAEAYDARADVRKAEGKEDLAKVDRARAREVRAADTVLARSKYEDGLKLLNGGREHDSIALFTDAIRADGTYGAAWYGRAVARFKLFEMLDAALDIARALELEPRYADDVFDRASEQADLDLAPLYADVEKLLETSPDDVSALFIRGLYGCVRTYMGRSDQAEREKALASLDRTIILSPQHTFAYTCRGYLRQNKGELDKALRDVKRAEQLDDRSVLSPFLAALVLAKKNQRVPALDALDRAAQRGFKNLERLKAEPAFTPLQADPRWAGIRERVEANAARAASGGK